MFGLWKRIANRKKRKEKSPSVKSRWEELRDAVLKSDVKLVSQLLSTYPGLRYRKEDCLQLAASQGDTSMAEFLVQEGANPTLALSYSNWGGGHGEVEILLSLGADPNDALSSLIERNIDRRGFDPKKLEYGKLLLQNGANPNPFLHTAIFHGELELVKLLLAHGADPNCSPPPSGKWQDIPPIHRALAQHALHQASGLSDAEERGEITLLLIQYGADPNIPYDPEKGRRSQSGPFSEEKQSGLTAFEYAQQVVQKSQEAEQKWIRDHEASERMLREAASPKRRRNVRRGPDGESLIYDEY